MNKYLNDIEGSVRESVEIRAAFLMQRAHNQQTRDDGAAVYLQANQIASIIVSRLLRDYRIVRKSKTERTVRQ